MNILQATPADFKDDMKRTALLGLIWVATGTLLGWVAANVPTANGVILIYFIFLTLYLVGFIIDIIRDHIKPDLPFAVIGINGLIAKSPMLITIGILGGLWLSYFMVGINFAIAIPLSIGIEQNYLDAVYKVFDSPIIEDLFFRALLIPFIAIMLTVLTPIKDFGKSAFFIGLIAATPIAAAIFALTHFFAFAGNFALMFTSFIWALLASVFAVFFGILASISFHFGNNATIFFGNSSAFWIFLAFTVFVVVINIYIITRIGIKKWAWA